jgi:hypothetical protein
MLLNPEIAARGPHDLEMVAASRCSTSSPMDATRAWRSTLDWEEVEFDATELEAFASSTIDTRRHAVHRRVSKLKRDLYVRRRKKQLGASREAAG